jgi:RNA polymerase sigma-70 factor (ECF subfamily)
MKTHGRTVMEPRHRTAGGGDRWYRTVYEAHATPLLDYFLRRVAEDHAHDLVAEVFLIVWRRRAIAPDEPDLRPWLFKVASNVLRNHHRGVARRMRLHERLRAYARTDTARQPPEQSDTDAILRWALAQLREPDREVLRLTAWEGCTTDELAKAAARPTPPPSGCTGHGAGYAMCSPRCRSTRRRMPDRPSPQLEGLGGGHDA